MTTSKLRWIIITAIIFTVGAALCLATTITMARTSSMAYCTSCHEMAKYKHELEKSSHAVDKEQKPIECAQCHIPNSFGTKYLTVKILSGMRDLWVHRFGNPDNLERRRLQEVARRFMVDANCRTCHEDLLKTTKGEAISQIGKLSHEAYLGQNGNTSRGCAGCHFNMAHLPDFDRRYAFNAEFAQNLPPAKERP